MTDHDFSAGASSQATTHRPGSNAPQQAEQLADRMAADERLRVRIPLIGGKRDGTPELHDGTRTVGRISLHAVELLEAEGRLVEASRSPFRRTLTYREAAPEPKKPEPEQQPSTNQHEDSDMNEPTQTDGPVRLTYGDTLTSPELAPILGVSSSRVCQLVQAETLTGEKEGGRSTRSPYHITVDGFLMEELDKRGIAYEIEGVPEQPASAETDEADDEREREEAEAAEPDVVPAVGRFPTVEEVRGDGAPSGQVEEAELDARPHPLDELLDDVNGGVLAPPLEVLLDEVRNATIELVYRSLFGEGTAESSERVRSAVTAAEAAMDAARHTLDEAERIAGLNELPAVRTTSAPHEEEA